MNLKTYDITNCAAFGNNRKHPPMMTMNKAGLISLNANLVQKLKLKAGMKVLFHQDEEKPADWFIELVDETNELGFDLRVVKGSNSLGIQRAKLVALVKESLNDTSKASLRMLVGAELEHKGKVLWPIITKSANIHK